VLPLIILHQLHRILNKKQNYQINVVIITWLNMFLVLGLNLALKIENLHVLSTYLSGYCECYL